MRKPRRQQLDYENGGFCHLSSRCVRQAFLLGKNFDTGKDFSYRRDWIEKRVLFLASVFSVELFGYAIMENHYHLVVNFIPKLAALWSPEEVARRWLRLRPRKTPELDDLWVEDVLSNSDYLEELRERLCTAPHFMKELNEYIARRANHEEQTSGAFWSGRYYSRAIKNEDDMVGCMAYVDLNPLRAGVVKEAEQPGQHTSLVRRLEEIEFHQAQETAQPHEVSGTAESSDKSRHLAQSQDDDSDKKQPSIPLRPLVGGHDRLVTRSLDIGTELQITLNSYRNRVSVLAKHGAGLPQKKRKRSRKRTGSEDWLDHWLHLMKGFRRRGPARTPLYSWMKDDIQRES